VTSKVRAAEVRWNRVATYRLVALTESTATVDVSISMRAGSQPIRVEPNATTRLTSGKSSVTGQLVIPLHGVVATGSLQQTSELSLQSVRRLLRVQSTTRTESQLTVRPANELDAPSAPDN
jgi:hypothetical protein